MDVHCKILESKDSLKYRALRLESLRLHPECFGSGYEAQSKMPKLYFEGLIESASQESVMIGAFIGEELVGLCGLTPIDDSSLEVIQMFVTSSSRGRAISIKMLNLAKLLLESRNEAELRLTVFTNNTHAISTYNESGFECLQTLGNESVMTFKL